VVWVAADAQRVEARPGCGRRSLVAHL